MTIKLTALGFALVLLAAPQAQAQAQQDDDETNAIDDQPHVTIIGTAHAEVVPDIASMSLGVTIEKPSATDAMNEAARIATAIIDTAKAQGIEARDIRTQAVTLTQTFDTLTDAHGTPTGRKPRGFEAGETIDIRVRALDKAGRLAQSLVEKGSTRFGGLTFSFEHPEAVMDRLTKEAVEDAKRRATIAAEAIGAKLGRVLLIERPSAPNALRAYPVASRMAAMPVPVPVEPGTQSLSTDIEVTWALE